MKTQSFSWEWSTGQGIEKTDVGVVGAMASCPLPQAESPASLLVSEEDLPLKPGSLNVLSSRHQSLFCLVTF